MTLESSSRSLEHPAKSVKDKGEEEEEGEEEGEGEASEEEEEAAVKSAA